MPEAYSQNRMAEMGMPQVAQWGEGMVDKYRANKWQGEQDELASALDPQDSQHPVVQNTPIEVDEVEMLNAGGDPQVAFNNRGQGGGNRAANIGSAAGNMFGKWARGGFPT